MLIALQHVANRIGQLASFHKSDYAPVSARESYSRANELKHIRYLRTFRPSLMAHKLEMALTYLLRNTRQVMSSDCRVVPTNSSTRFIRNCSVSCAFLSGRMRIAPCQ